MKTITPTNGDALDLLESEDLELRRLFKRIEMLQGVSVQERADYGDLAKSTIHHLATREAAITQVADALTQSAELEPLVSRLEADMSVRRPLIDRVEKMSRGVQGINLNQGQDFDGALQDVMQEVGSEIEWELDEVLPAVKATLRNEGDQPDLPDADYVTRHAPTNLHPDGPRWVERAPVISRLITIYDRLRDFPQSRRKI